MLICSKRALILIAVVTSILSCTDARGQISKKQLERPPCMTVPAASPWAILVCVHDIYLHGGCFESFAKTMASKGVSVYAVDVRGFGSYHYSPSRHGELNFDYALEDLNKTIKIVSKVSPNVPIFLVGEGMGAAIAVRTLAALGDLVRGAVLAAPSTDRFSHARTLHGAAFVRAGLRSTEVGWETDPDIGKPLSEADHHKYKRFLSSAEKYWERNTAPTLVVQGCRDKVTRPEGAKKLFNSMPTKDKELLLVKGGEHLLFEFVPTDPQLVESVLLRLRNHSSLRTRGAPEHS